MYNILQTQFDFKDYSPRKVPNQIEFENANHDLFETFRTHAYSSFEHMKTFLDYVPIVERGKNLKATLLNGMICGKMALSFPEKCKKINNGRIAYVSHEGTVFFKKLGAKRLPNHIPTKSALILELNIEQQTSTGSCVIWMGYTISEDWNMITGLYAICLNQYNGWETDILDYLNSKAKQTIGKIEPISRVKPKLNDKTKKKTNTGT